MVSMKEAMKAVAYELGANLALGLSNAFAGTYVTLGVLAVRAAAKLNVPAVPPIKTPTKEQN